MTQPQFLKTIGASAVLAGLVVGGMLISSKRGQANDSFDFGDEGKVEKGFELAPVQLNLHHKDPRLVGLGSYLVNAVGGCNDCHTAQPYAAGGDPYQGQHPTKVNPVGYLAGGTKFGPFTSRNLTPNKAGQAEGGHTFSDFLLIIRTGVDLDKAHPTLPPPFDGTKLQVMPWPIYANMTTHELHAIYEYLGAIPCVEGGPGEPPNRCQ
jgi:hypothetical protein